MANNLEKLEEYQQQQKQINQEYPRRTEPILQMNYQEKDGLMYPEVAKLVQNHELTPVEKTIQQYLEEQRPTLYQELKITGQLMIYLNQKQQEIQTKEQTEYLKQMETIAPTLPKDLLQRTRKLNQLKQQIHETVLAQMMPIQ
uniref:TnpV protein n=1 Tax=Enterococcus hulanensis TaxID=2559929 RepID=UPI0036F42BE6